MKTLVAGLGRLQGDCRQLPDICFLQRWGLRTRKNKLEEKRWLIVWKGGYYLQ